jgi:hypothetical protein
MSRPHSDATDDDKPQDITCTVGIKINFGLLKQPADNKKDDVNGE